MKSMLEGFRRKAKGLYSPYTRDRRNIERNSERVADGESAFFGEKAEPGWAHYDSPPEDQFLKMGDGLEGFGDLLSFEDVKDWVQEQHERGKKVASIDVFGQPGLGLAAGVDKAIGWSLHDWRAHEVRGKDPREKMMPGSVFDVASRKKVFQELDAANADGIALGLVFFRPWAGVTEFQNSRYAHLYLYEFILRPLYERLEEGGMMLLASQNLAGMHLLFNLLEKSGMGQVTTNDTRQSYLIKKSKEIPQLRSLGDMGNLSDIGLEFLAAEMENILPSRTVRWAHRAIMSKLRKKLSRTKQQ